MKNYLQHFLFIILCINPTLSFCIPEVFIYINKDCFEKYEYESLRHPPQKQTDYHYWLNENTKLIFNTYTPFKRLNALPDQTVSCENINTLNRQLANQINQAKIDAFVVEQSGESFIVYAVKSVAYVSEGMQRISYIHPDIEFEYIKAQPNIQKVLNPDNNRESNLFFKDSTNYNCKTMYNFDLVPHCQQHSVTPVSWLSGMGFYNRGYGQETLQLIRINNMPIDDYILQKCDDFDHQIDIAPSNIYVSTSNKSYKKNTLRAQLTALGQPRQGIIGNYSSNPKKHKTISKQNPYYIAQFQDCLYSISQKFDIPVNRLIELNALNNYNINVNQKIRVVDDLSIPKRQRYPIVRIDEKSHTKIIIHLAQQGQTLYGIAKLYDISLPELISMNHHLKNDKININQHLIVGLIKQ